MTGDQAVWLVFAILLALLGMRAWLVEVSPARGGNDREIRVATIAACVTLLVLIVVVALEGGIELGNLIRKTM